MNLVLPVTQRWPARRNRNIAIGICALMVAVPTGCSEDPVPAGTSESQQTSKPAAHNISWLTVDDDLPPEQWLSSRNEPALRPMTDFNVQRVKALLDIAHRLYRESPRMIANRTVQLEAMLAAAGHKDHAIEILSSLADVPGEVGQTEGYGAIGQHYVNLRSAGHDRETALARLKQLYGKRPQK